LGGGDPARLVIIAAYNDVAVNFSIAIEQARRNIVESSHHGHFLRNQFCGLLSCRSLPHTQYAARAPAYCGCERDGGVDENRARFHSRLQSFEQFGLSLEWHSQYVQFRGGAGVCIPES